MAILGVKTCRVDEDESLLVAGVWCAENRVLSPKSSARGKNPESPVRQTEDPGHCPNVLR